MKAAAPTRTTTTRARRVVAIWEQFLIQNFAPLQSSNTSKMNDNKSRSSVAITCNHMQFSFAFAERNSGRGNFSFSFSFTFSLTKVAAWVVRLRAVRTACSTMMDVRLWTLIHSRPVQALCAKLRTMSTRAGQGNRGGGVRRSRDIYMATDGAARRRGGATSSRGHLINAAKPSTSISGHLRL